MPGWFERVLLSGVRAPRRSMVWLVARRDLRESLSDSRLTLAMGLLTCLIPLIATGGVALADRFLGPGGRGITQRLVEVGAFFVVFLPASFSLVLALESFSGERERNTLESLFATPLRESEIYLGKVAAVIIPSLSLSYVALVVYTVAALAVVHLVAVEEIAPLAVVTMAQAVLMVAGATIVSSQTKTLRSANVMASFVIIPMSAVIQGESVLIISHLEWILWAVAAMLAVVALLLLRLGIVGFNRESILAKESRPPDRRALLARVVRSIPGPSRWPGIARALPRDVRGAFARTRTAIAVASALLFAGVVLGALGERLVSAPAQPIAALAGSQSTIAHQVVAGDPMAFWGILFHNLAAGSLMAVVAPVSLGVLGSLFTLLNGAVVGFVGGYYAGTSRLGFFACGVLPHGVFEIPALVLASAFALRIGASMVRPSAGGWLAGIRLALADYVRGMVVVWPLFVVAAFVEAFITLRVVQGC